MEASRKVVISIMVSLSLLFLGFGTVGVVSASEEAASFPSREITIYITFSAGGSTDLSTRALAEAASKILGQPIVCVNKPGGMGAVALGELVRKKPDGYTLGNLYTAIMAIVPNMRELPFEPVRDIKPVVGFSTYLYAAGVKADAPWKTWEEFRDYAKANPGKVTYGTAGIGNSTHICMEQIALADGIKWKHVPFKGGAKALTACLGGHIDAAAPGNEFVPQALAGTFRPLLILSPERFPVFPDVPSITEKGYDFSALSAGGLGAPQGIPEPIRKKLENAFKEATKDPNFLKTMENLRMPVTFRSGPELERIYKGDFQKKRDILQKMGIGKK